MNNLQHSIFKFKGIVKDIEPVELMNGAPPTPGAPSPNVWTHGLNVHFENESTLRSGGYKGFADPLPSGASPIYQMNVLPPDASYWIWVDEQNGSARIYVTDGGNHFNITPGFGVDLVTNGTFDTDTDWTKSTNAIISNGVCTLPLVAGPVSEWVSQDIAVVQGTEYTVQIDVLAATADTQCEIWIGNVSSPSMTAPGTYVYQMVADVGVDLRITTVEIQGAGSDVIIDNVSVKATAAVLMSSNPGAWTSCVLNGVPVLNNGVDAPIWWNGDTGAAMTELPDWPALTSCKSIRAYKFHLIAMNITQNSVQIPEKLMWSAGADPGTIPQSWTPEPSNDAGDNILAVGNGGIVDGLKLRDNFIIYKSHQTYLMSYVGGQFVFSFRSLFNTSGIQSVNCVQELRGHHWVFTDDDIIRHDGNTFSSIADKAVRKFILGDINPETQQLSHVAKRVPTDEIWFCVPTVDQTRIRFALVYSFTDNVWGVRELPDVSFVASGIIPFEGVNPRWDAAPTTWEEDVRTWGQAAYSATNDQLLMSAPESSKLYNVDAAQDNDGVPVAAYVERRDWTVGGQSNIWDNVLVRAIYPIITGTDGDIVQIKIAGTQVAGEDINWEQEQDYTIGQSAKIDSMTFGRYLNMRFSSSGGNPWAIHRIGIEFIPEAKF